MKIHKKTGEQGSMVTALVLMTSLVFILLLAGWQLAERDFEDIVPIENVEIEGRFENLSLSEIRSKLVNVLDGGYFTVDLDGVRGALLELPWVEDASIRRQWPSGLHIKVVEKQVVAYWGESMLLSSQGVLFTPATHTRDPELPVLEGPQGLHSMVWSFMQRLHGEFDSLQMQVTQLKLDQRRAWSIYATGESVDDEIEIKLGRENIDRRLARFVNVFSSHSSLLLNDIEVIDLRYPNGFAMRKNSAKKTIINKNAELVTEVYIA